MTTPTPAQIRKFLTATHQAVRPHWGRHPVVVSLYRPSPGDDPGALRWSLIPVPPKAWTEDPPPQVLATTAASLTTPEGLYCLSALRAWDRWCGVGAVMEAWYNPHGHPQGEPREQVHLVAALVHGATTVHRPPVWVYTWGRNSPAITPDREGDPYDTTEDGGTLIEGLYHLGAAMTKARNRIVEARLPAPQEATHTGCPPHPPADLATHQRD